MPTTLLRRVFVYWLVCISCWPVQLISATGENGQDKQPSISLKGHPRYLIDTEAKFTLEDILQGELPQHPKKNPSFGWIQDVVWLVYDFQKDDHNSYIAEIDYPLLDDIKIFIIRDSSPILELQAGDSVPHSPGVLDQINPTFPLPLETGEYKIVLRVRTTSSLQAPLNIFEQGVFRDKERSDLLITGFYAGILSIMALYNFFVYLATHHRAYLYYTCFVSCFLLLQLSLSGYTAYYIWPEYPALSDYTICQGGFVTALFMVLFARDFLGLHKTGKQRMMLIRILHWTLVSTLIVSFFIGYRYGVKLLASITGISVVTTLSIATYQLFQGQREARFYLAAWFIFIISFMVYILKQSGFFPITPLSQHAFKLGSLVEIAMLSFALADRLNTMRNQLKKANNELTQHINMLVDKERATRHSYEQLEKIIYPHQIELIKKGWNLENTMPTHYSKACVICFDIQSSSRIQHERVKDFLQNIFQRCGRLMMEGYDPEEMKTRGYRIKEMGDGFLCSVGYPFKSPSGRLAEDALALAMDFLEQFEREVSLLEYREPICCGIALAMDHIQGIYPLFGAKEYDLYGRAIVLATRYEAMRKPLLNGRSNYNVIILQERVFASLRPKTQQLFFEYRLADHGVTVRDDPEATRLYYRLLPPRDRQNNAGEQTFEHVS